MTKPSSPVDGKYVTKAMGHESWVHVATTFFDGKITACEVLSHEETIGIGNYACSRIPAAIVEHQSVNVPNLRGSSITSMAVKAAVKEAIELAGYNVDDFSKEVTIAASNEVIEEEADVVIMGAGTLSCHFWKAKCAPAACWRPATASFWWRSAISPAAPCP